MNTKTLRFIEEHLQDDVRQLALQAGRYTAVNMPYALTQIAGHQAAVNKLPTWSRTKGIRYPAHLSMEQCSSELTARYKATLLQGDSFADLTGGFGIDCYFLSQQFNTSTYVERQEELCHIATHNFALLQRPDITVMHCDATEHLRSMTPVDGLFLDPARRDNHGGKTVAIADCEPNVEQLESLLVQKGKRVLVKLSPMLDIALALRTLHHVREVHIVSVNNECKELLLLLSAENNLSAIVKGNNTHRMSENVPTPTEQTQNIPKETEKEPSEKRSHNDKMGTTLCCVNLKSDGTTSPFRFTTHEEATAECSYTDTPATYLYEPNASLMKAGAFRIPAQRFGLKKLHPSSHLYTGDTYLPDFPGRSFVIEQTVGFGKKELKLLSALKQANLTVRNFPATVNELRKKLKLSDGGSTYLFATTLNDGRKVLLQCKKVE